MRTYHTCKLVKSEDLNHHGTLFAGRGSEWFVEGCFIAAAAMLSPENIVCKKIHGLNFLQPVKNGEIIHMESKVVLVGRTSLKVYGKIVKADDSLVLEGFLTFVHVDKNGSPVPHGLEEIKPTNPEEQRLIQKARLLKR
ncbi:MAG: acyl-CoA thioesterase [Desulfitobacteriia bacterium]